MSYRMSTKMTIFSRVILPITSVTVSSALSAVLAVYMIKPAIDRSST